jgi:YcxB-like protein
MKLVRRLFLFSFIASLVGLVLNLITTSGQVKNWYYIILEPLTYPLFLFAFFFVLTIIGAILLMTFRGNHFKDVTYTFTHWGMEKIGKGIEFSRPWSKFLRFKESRHFLFLYISENDAHIIQKRMFKSDDEIESLKQLIFRHLNSA